MPIFEMQISLIIITNISYIMVNRDVCNIEISLNQMHLEVHVQKYVNKFRYLKYIFFKKKKIILPWSIIISSG